MNFQVANNSKEETLFALNLSLLMKQQLAVDAMFTNHIEAYVSRRLQDYHDLSM
jgi:hypothetical protein